MDWQNRLLPHPPTLHERLERVVMAHLTVFAIVLSDDADVMPRRRDIGIRLPEGPLDEAFFAPLRRWFSGGQVEQIYSGVDALRRTFSSMVVTEVVAMRVTSDDLSRFHVTSAAQLSRLQSGDVSVSLILPADFQGRGKTGRPGATRIDDAFKKAFSEQVARHMRLSELVERDDVESVENDYRLVGERLEGRSALFNLNRSHRNDHEFPVRHWCETHGPASLAKSYDLRPKSLEQLLDAAFKDRLRRDGLENVMRKEREMIETLSLWYGAHIERKSGEASRRDTTRRVLKDHMLDWTNAPGAIAPPSTRGDVMRSLVAERAMQSLGTKSMVEAAIQFELEPAYSVFFTRQYLLPILAVAGMAGRVALRRRAFQIRSPITAGGLVALHERGVAGPFPRRRQTDYVDELAELQDFVAGILEEAGCSVAELAMLGEKYLKHGAPVFVEPPAGPKRFFVSD